jgi:hypothetical protein
LAQLLRFIAKDREDSARSGRPATWLYDISQNDNDDGSLCFCPVCMALEKEEASASAPLIDFINSIADGVKSEYPDVKIRTLAYSGTLKAPKTLKPRANVIIRIAQISAEHLEKEPLHYPDLFKPLLHTVNQVPREDFLSWSKAAEHVAYYDYWVAYCDRFPTPYANIACMRSDLQFLYASNVRFFYSECEYPVTTSFSALKRWFGFKLLQDTGRLADDLIQTFMTGYYGPAAAKMRSYLDYMEKRIAAAAPDSKLSFIPECERQYLDLDFFTAADRLLTEAEGLCDPASAETLHIRHERIPLDSALNNMWLRLEKNMPAGWKMPFDRQEIIRRYGENYTAQWRAHYGGDIPGKIKMIVDKKIKQARELPDLERLKSAPPPSLCVPMIAEAGGDPARADWSRAAVADQWREVTGCGSDRNPVASLAHDGKYLYIRLEEPCDILKLVRTGPIYNGDDWEIFLSGEPSRQPYYHIAAGPGGEKRLYVWPEVKKQETKWDANVRVISDKTNARWTVSLSVPLNKILPGDVKPGSKLFANFFRGNPALDWRDIETLENLVRAESNGSLAWSPTFEKDFHLPQRFGVLILE